MYQNDDESTYEIEDCHYRNYHGGYLCNGLDTTDNYYQCKNEYHSSNGVNADSGYRIEGACDGVALSKVSDTKGCDYCEDCEADSKESAESLRFLAVDLRNTSLHGHHGSAQHLTLIVGGTIAESQSALSEFGCESEGCRDQHPYESSGAACCQSSSDSCDVTGTDGGSKGCTKGCKGRNVSFTFGLSCLFGQGRFDGVSQCTP